VAARALAPAAAVVLALGALATALALRPRPEPLPVLGRLSPFALTGHDGHALTLESLRGHAFVANFMFTRCAGICPAMTARLAQLQGRLPEGVAIVSFTVDPQHDTPEVLARYARDFHAGPAWTFATGPKQTLYDLATRDFKLTAVELAPDQRQDGDGPFVHSGKLVLVDGAGRIRGYYDSDDSQAVARLLGDIARAETS
jgi:protein SCO1/2